MKDDQFTQILRAINDVRDDMKEFKKEMNRRWDENDKRWEENDKKWEENDKKWEENRKALDKIHEKMDRNHKEMRTTFDAYENSIENMYQDNKKRIINLEKRLKVASA